MTCWWHCSRHRSITGRSVIIQLSVASTQLVSLTPKPPCLRSYIRQGPPGWLAGLAAAIAVDRVAPSHDENKVVSSRLVVVRQPITFRFSFDNRPSRLLPSCVQDPLLFNNKIAFQSKTDHQRICVFRSYDLDLEPMTLIFDLDLDVLNMYRYTENEVSSLRLSIVRTRTALTHTNRCDRMPCHARLIHGW